MRDLRCMVVAVIASAMVIVVIATATTVDATPTCRNVVVRDDVLPSPEPIPPVGARCPLLDRFAIIVQLLMATLAAASLVVKHFREHPRRPHVVWLLDSAKQACAAALVHASNVAIALVAGDEPASAVRNPCIWYFLNILIDTTVGVLILALYLHVLTRICMYFGIRGLRSGFYGVPPRIFTWFKQLLLFLTAWFLLKVTVVVFLRFVPVLPALAERLLAPLLGSDGHDTHAQVIVVMLIFPMLMNVVQAWLIDTVIKGKPQPHHHHRHHHRHRGASNRGGRRPHGTPRSQAYHTTGDGGAGVIYDYNDEDGDSYNVAQDNPNGDYTNDDESYSDSDSAGQYSAGNRGVIGDGSSRRGSGGTFAERGDGAVISPASGSSSARHPKRHHNAQPSLLDEDDLLRRLETQLTSAGTGDNVDGDDHHSNVGRGRSWTHSAIDTTRQISRRDSDGIDTAALSAVASPDNDVDSLLFSDESGAGTPYRLTGAHTLTYNSYANPPS